MAVDALLALQASVTKTSTFNGTGLAIPNGTPRRGLTARVEYSAAAVGSSTGTAIFSIDYSPDAGSTWYSNLATAETVALSTTNASGEIFIPFVTPLDAANNANAQVRLTVTLTGSSPTVTYNSYIGNAMP